MCNLFEKSTQAWNALVGKHASNSRPGREFAAASSTSFNVAACFSILMPIVSGFKTKTGILMISSLILTGLGNYSTVQAQSQSVSGNSEAVPVVTISSEREYRDSSDTHAEFFIHADPPPIGVLSVSYLKHVALAGNIDTERVSLPQSVEFADGVSRMPINVPIDDNSGPRTLNRITLVADGTGNYTVGDQSQSFLPPIATNEKPLIEISSSQSGVVEGEEISFELVAKPGLNEDMEVAVHVTQGQGENFLAGILTNGKLLLNETILMSGSRKSFTVMTRMDLASSMDGAVTATVQPSQKYVFGTEFNGETGVKSDSSTVKISDNGLVGLSVSDAPAVSEAGTAEFTITSSALVRGALNVRYRVSEVYGDFLIDSIQDTVLTERLLFFRDRANEPFTASISVPIADDSVNENDGLIHFSLEDDDSDPAAYLVNGDSDIATAMIADDDVPELSISDAPDVTESAMAVAEFVIASSIETMPLNVRYTPSEVMGGDFLDSSNEQLITSHSLNFAQVSGGGDFAATIRIPIQDDRLDEADGQIQVTLEDSLVSAQYLVNSEANTAVASVSDDELPMLGMVQPVGTFAESEIVPIKLVSNMLPHQPLTVSYRAFTGTGDTRSESSFLNSEPTYASQTLTFMLDEDGLYSSMLIIPLTDDDVNEAENQLRVFLEDDPLANDTYAYDSAANTVGVSVSVVDNDVPVLTVQSNGASVVESAGVASFTITAVGANATSSLDIQYTLAEVSGGDFLASANEGATSTGALVFNRIENMQTGFNRNEDGRTFSTVLSVPLDNDSDREGNGSISVTLNADTSGWVDYRVSDSNGSATVEVIDDDLPVLSVVPPSLPNAYESHVSSITVVSNALPSNPGISVNYKLTNIEGNFISSSGSPQTYDLTLALDGNGQVAGAIENVTFDDDELEETDGRIEFSLLPGDSGSEEYLLADSNTSFELDVLDNDGPEPEFSISAENATYFFEGEVVTFYVDSNQEMTNKHFLVTSRVRNAVGDFLDGNYECGDCPYDRVSHFYPFASTNASKTRGSFYIRTEDDSIGENSGSISVTLVPKSAISYQSGYSVRPGMGTATVAMHDNDKPVLLIEEPLEPVGENETAHFYVFSNLPGDVVVSYTPTNVTGDFLGDAAGVPVTARTEYLGPYAYGGYLSTLSVPLDNDQSNEPSGAVRVTLNPDTTGALDYSVSSESDSAVVYVKDDDIPVLSISNPSNPVTIEPGPVQFPLTVSINPYRPLKIAYTPSNRSDPGFGTYLSGSINGILQPAEITFTGNADSDGGTATLELELDNDRYMDAQGEITVTLHGGSDSEVDFDYDGVVDYKISSASDTATASVGDDETPIIWLTAEESVQEGDNLPLTVHSSFNPVKSLEVKFTTHNEVGNFIVASPSTHLSEDLRFANRTAQFNVSIPDNENIEGNGIIRVTLRENPDQYVLRGNYDSVDVHVTNNDKPELSLTSTGGDLIESDRFSVSVVSNKVPLNPLLVKYTLQNGSGNYFGPMSGTTYSASLSFTDSGGVISAEFQLGLDDDEIREAPGSVSVLLVESELYDIKLNGGRTVREVRDNDAWELSLENSAVAVSESGRASFAVTARNAKGPAEFEVSYTPTNVQGMGDFLGGMADISRTAELSFTLDDQTMEYGAELLVQLDDDIIDEADGQISVSLNDDPGGSFDYYVSRDSASATAVITDNDLPAISISNAQSVSEGGTAAFTLTSNVETQNLAIRYTPSEVGGGDFLVDAMEVVRTSEILSFSQSGGSGPFQAVLNIANDVLHDDETDEADGKIMVTLEADSSNPVTYTVDADADSATAAITDNDVPVLEIGGENGLLGGGYGYYNSHLKSGYTPKRESDTLEFRLSTNIKPHKPLLVRYSVAGTVNFFGTEFNTVKTSQQTFTDDGDGNFVSTLRVPLVPNSIDTLDPVGLQSEGDRRRFIRVNIKSNSTDYKTISGGFTASYQVLHDTPEISISNAPDVMESGPARFVITADVKPPAGLAVRYTVEEVSDGDFLPAANSTPVTSDEIVFTRSENGENWVSTLEVPLDDDNVTEADGSITVTLNEDTAVPLTVYDPYAISYTLSETLPLSATANVMDNDTPVLSISNAPTVEEGGASAFTVTAASQPLGPLMVRYSASNGTGNFLGINTSPQELTFSESGGKFVSNLNVNLDDDTRGEGEGTIEIRLLDDTNDPATYLVHESDHSATGTVTDNDGGTLLPELYIKDAQPVSEDGTAVFNVFSRTIPPVSLNLNYMARNVTGNFLGTRDNLLSIALNREFTDAGNGEYSTSFELALAKDSTHIGTGAVEVTLSPTSHYAVIEDADTASVAVFDTAVPELSIENADAVTESESAMFNVTASFNPGADLSVQFTPANVTGDFLGSSDGIGTSGAVAFGSNPGKLTLPLSVSLDDDEIYEAAGTVRVTLNADSVGNADYTVSAEFGSATVEVMDNDLPELSIGNASPASESGWIEFPVKSTKLPLAPLNVSFTPMAVGTGNFLELASNAVASETLTFELNSSSEYAAALRLDLVDDLVGNSDRSVQVTLNADTEGTRDYVVSETEFSATAVVNNDDLPELTILTPQQGSEDRTMDIQVSSTMNPGRAMPVKYMLENAAGDFLGTANGVEQSQELTFRNETVSDTYSGLTIEFGTYLATLPVTLDNDTRDEPDGSVRVTLVENPGTYTVNGLTSTVLVGVSDDDVPALSIGNAPSVTESGPAVFTVTSDMETNQHLTVNFTKTNVTGDFLGTESGQRFISRLSFSDNGNGIHTATVEVMLDDDEIDEPDGSVSVALNSDSSDPATYTVSEVPGADSATASVSDNDTAPVMAISNVTAIESDGMVRFTASMNRTTVKTVSFSYTSIDGSAIGGLDFTTVSEERLTFNPGERIKHIDVILNDDRLNEENETFALNFHSPSNAVFSGGVDAITTYATITDDDGLPELSIASASETEATGALTFTVALSPDSSREVRVNYLTEVRPADTAAAGEDFVSSSGTLVFAIGEVSRTFTVSVIEDASPEENETFSVKLLRPVGAAIGTGAATGTIEDDDSGEPVAWLGERTIYQQENQNAEDVPVFLSRAATKNVKVYFRYAEGTAELDDDFFRSDAAESDEHGLYVSIPIGESEGTVPYAMATSVDTVPEPDEEFQLVLTRAESAILSDNSELLRTTVVILDSSNDNRPVISIGRSIQSVTEGERAGFLVQASSAPPAALKVKIGLSEGDGDFIDKTVAGLEFGSQSEVSSVLTIETGYAAMTDLPLNVDTVDDRIGEQDGILTATVLDGEGYQVGTANSSSSITIVDNDWPEVSISSAGGDSVAEGDDAVFRVSVNPPPAEGTLLPIKLSVSQLGGFYLAEPAGDRTVLVTSSGTYDHRERTQGYSLSNAVFGDPFFASDPIITAEVSRDGGYNRHRTPANSSVTLKVMDTDISESRITFDPTAVATEGPGQVTMTFDLALENPNNLNVSVDVEVSGGTAILGSDYELTASRVNFGSGRTAGQITINVINDDLIEEPETVVLTLTAVRGVFSGGSKSAEVTGTINSEDLPGFSISTPYSSVSDSDYIEFTIVADQAPLAQTDVDLDIADGDGVIATANAPVRFEPGETEMTRRLEFNPGAAGSGAGSEIAVSIAPSLGNYEVDPDVERNSFSVTVVSAAALPTVSVSAVGAVSEGHPALFAVSVADAPDQTRSVPLTVGIRVSNGTGDFLSDMTVGSISIPSGMNSATYSVATSGDSTADGNDGVIRAELLPGTGYKLAPDAADRSADATVLDNGGAFEITVLNSSATATEGADQTAISYKLRFSRPYDGTVSVSATDSATGTAELSDDYTLAPVTFSHNDREGLVTVTIVDDALDENLESFELMLIANGATFAGGGTAAAVTGTINDNDPLPKVTVVGNSVREDVSGGKLTFDVTLTPASGREVGLEYLIDEISTADSTDYTMDTGSISPIAIPAGDETATISMTLNDDSDFELDETVILNLTATNAEFSADVSTGRAAATILQDSDPDLRPTVTITGPATVSEDAGSFEVILTADPAPAAGEVVVTTLAGRDRAGSVDGYFGGLASGPVVIGSSGAATVAVAVNDDVSYRGWGVLEFSLESTESYKPPVVNHVLLVTVEDDEKSEVKIDVTGPDSVVEGDSFDVTLALNSQLGAGKTVTVDFTVDDSGAAGNYFGGVSRDQVVLSGPSDSETVTVSTNGDAEFRGNGEITFTVVRGDGYEPGDMSPMTVRVEEDDPDPSLHSVSVSVESTRVLEGDPVHVTLTAEPAPQAGQTLEVTTFMASDLGNPTGYFDSLTPANPAPDSPGSVFIDSTGTATVTITTNDISGFIGDGMIRMTLTDTATYSADRSTDEIVVSVIDDDNPALPELSISKVSIAPDTDTAATIGQEGSAFLFRITSSIPAESDLPVNFTVSQTGDFIGRSSNGPEGHVHVAGRAEGTMDMDSSILTVAVGTVDDALDEADGSITLEIERGIGYRIAQSSAKAATVTVTDDEPLPVIEVGRPSVREDDSGGKLEFDVSLTPASGRDVSLVYSVDPTSTAKEATDYIIDSGSESPITISAGETSAMISFTLVNDVKFEQDETVLLNLTVENARFGPGFVADSLPGAFPVALPSLSGNTLTDTVIGTIESDGDGDARPVISLTAPAEVNEGDGSFEVTLTADPAPSEGETISVTTLSGADSAVSVGGYFGGILPSTVEIGSSGTGTATVAVNDDSTYRGWGELEFTLTETEDYRLSSDVQLVLVIIEDDEESEVEISADGPESVNEGDTFTFTLTANSQLGAYETVSVNYAINDSGAVGNYLIGKTGGQVNITGPSGTAMVTVWTNEYESFRGNGEITLKVLRGDGYEPGTVSSATVLVEDDDPDPSLPSVSVFVESNRVLEGDPIKVTLTASPKPAIGQVLKVTSLLVLENNSSTGYLGSLTPDSLVLDSPGSIVIGSTGTTGVTIATNNLPASNGDGEIRITLTDTEHYSVNRDVGEIEVRVVDDENPLLPELSVSKVTLASDVDTAVATGAEGNSFLFHIVSSAPVDADLPVSFTVSQTGDFIGHNSQTSDGRISSVGGFERTMEMESNTLTIAVDTTDDALDEADGTVTLSMERGFGYRVVQSSARSATVTVVDDEPMPVIDVGNAMAKEDVSSGKLEFDVRLSHASDRDVSLAYAVDAAGTAEETSDYTIDSGSESPITISAGERSAKIAFTLVDDDRFEFDETLLLSLTAVNAQLSSNSATGIIEQDNDADTRPTVTISGPEMVNENEGSFKLTLTATPPPQSGQTLELSTLMGADKTGFAGGYFGGLSPATVEIDSSGTGLATVAVNDDGFYRGWGQLEFTLEETEDYKLSSDDHSLLVSVVEDEKAEVSVSASAPPRVKEGEAFEVTLNASAPLGIGESISVNLTVSESGPVGGFLKEYDREEAVITGPSNSATVTVSTHDHGTATGNGEITVTVLRGNGYEVEASDSEKVIVVDNDFNPALTAVSMSVESNRVVEGSEIAVVLKATPAPPVGKTLMVTSLKVGEIGNRTGLLRMQDAQNSDFGIPEAIRIGSSGTATVTIETTDDDFQNGDGRIFVLLTDTSTYTASRSSDLIYVDIVDDENTSFPVLSIVSAGSATQPYSNAETAEEGSVFLFWIESSRPFEKSLPVSFTVSQDGSFIGTATQVTKDHVQSDGPVELSFSKGAESLIVAVGTEDDSIDERDGSITLTIERGPGYRVAALERSSRTVLVRDNDDGETTIAVEKTTLEAVERSGKLEVAMDFVMTLNNPHDVEVMVTPKVLAGTAEFGADYRVDLREKRFGTGSEVTIRVHVRPDELPENDERFSIAVEANGAVFDNGSRSIVLEGIIRDDDRLPRISISTDRQSMVKGEPFQIALLASPSPSSDLEVSLEITQSGDFFFQSPPKHATIKSGTGVSNVVIATYDDLTDKTGEISVRVLSGSGYQIGTADAEGEQRVTVNILNSSRERNSKIFTIAGTVINSILSGNGAGLVGQVAGTPTVEVAIFAVNGQVQEGEPARFRVVASKAVAESTSVAVDLHDSGEFIGGGIGSIAVLIERNSNSAEFEIPTIDDDIAELDGRIVATIRDGTDYALSASHAATVSVLDDSDRNSRRERFENGSRQVLPEMLAHSGLSLMDAVSGRMSGGFEGAYGNSNGNVHGFSVSKLLEAGGGALNGDGTSLQSLIDNASFAINLAPEEGGSSSASVWGHGDGLDLSVAGSDSQSLWSGGMSAGHFGFDTRLDNGLLAGMTVSVSEAGMEFDTGNPNELNIAANSTGFGPYVGMATPSRDAELQVISGIGQSRIRISEGNYADETADSSFHLLGVNGRKLLYSNKSILTGGTSQLNAQLESWTSQQKIAGNDGFIGDLTVGVGFYGFELEGTHSQEFGNGLKVTPSIQLGFRGYDWNGIASNGLALDLGTGLDSPSGIMVEGSTFLETSQFNRIMRKGLQGSLEYDHGKDDLGTQLNLSSSWGWSSAEYGHLLPNGNFLSNEMELKDRADDFSMESEIGYGIGIWDGTSILKPYAGFEMDAGGLKSLYFGKNFSSRDSDMELKLEASRNDSGSGQVDSAVSISGSIKWQ